ncbi:hypothetical protein Tco_0143662 [Tanacetum coccineum]
MDRTLKAVSQPQSIMAVSQYVSSLQQHTTSMHELRNSNVALGPSPSTSTSANQSPFLPHLHPSTYNTYSSSTESSYLAKVLLSSLSEFFFQEAAPAGEQSGPPVPKTAKQLTKRNQERVKSILLLAIPNEYLLKFHNVPDAKSLWAAIKSRFGGNDESKKI